MLYALRQSDHHPGRTAPAGSLKPQASGCLLEVEGREELELHPGQNDLSRLAPGVYFVREEPSAVSRQPSGIRKVVLTR